VARHPGLEAALLADRDDPELYRVYGDWLESQGDPRGRLIALHFADAKPEATEHLQKHPELVPLSSSWAFRFEWDRGFIGAVELEDPSASDFEAVIGHPSCVLLSSLRVAISGSFAADVIGKIAERESSIRDLIVHHTVIPFELRAHPPIADAFWDRVPHLRSLSLSGPGLFATLRHQRLTRLRITGQEPFRNDEPWVAPALAVLEWGDANNGIDLLWESRVPGPSRSR